MSLISLSQNISQVAVINLMLGSASLNTWRTFYVPQTMISLEHNVVCEDANSLSVVLHHHIDPEGEDVTNLGSDVNMLMELIASMIGLDATHVRISYGYHYVKDTGESGYLMSPQFEYLITDVTFDLSPMGITYKISGTSALVEIITEPLEGAYNWYVDPENRVTAPTNNVASKLYNIVNHIFSERGYSVLWSRYPNNLDNIDVDKIESLLTQTTQNDMEFIKDILAHLMYVEKSSTTVYCNYVLTINDSDKTVTIGPSSVVHTDNEGTPINTCPHSTDTIYETYYYYLPNSDTSGYGKNQIISMSWEYPLFAALTSFRSGAFQGTDYNNETFEISFDDYYENNELNVAERLTSFARVMGQIPTSGLIKLPGDVNIIPVMTLIKIVMYVGGKLFFLSGDYIVLSKTDSIENGVFYTVLNVFKIWDYTFDTVSGSTQPGVNGPRTYQRNSLNGMKYCLE